MHVSELKPRQVQRLAKRVLETLPPPKRWWQFWRKDRLNPKVREVWEHIADRSRYWVGDISAYLDANTYDVLRDCVEHGPFDMNEFNDDPPEVS
jgi:hypothetical protein